MRTTIAIAVGVSVLVAGLLARLMRRKSPRVVDAGSVSGQWIAEQSSRSDST